MSWQLAGAAWQDLRCRQWLLALLLVISNLLIHWLLGRRPLAVRLPCDQRLSMLPRLLLHMLPRLLLHMLRSRRLLLLLLLWPWRPLRQLGWLLLQLLGRRQTWLLLLLLLRRRRLCLLLLQQLQQQ